MQIIQASPSPWIQYPASGDEDRAGDHDVRVSTRVKVQVGATEMGWGAFSSYRIRRLSRRINQTLGVTSIASNSSTGHKPDSIFPQIMTRATLPPNQ